MSSQSDDFARMIQLLEQILERLPPREYDPKVDTNVVWSGPVTTGDYVCPTCLGGECQCNTGAA